jgi:hypothetical protein
MACRRRRCRLAALGLLAPTSATDVNPHSIMQLLDTLEASYPLTVGRNTYSDAYHHMLRLRRLQPEGLIIGHIGWHPMQAFKYFWFARQVTAERLTKGLGPPTTCEVGFGTGHSASIFLSASTIEGDMKRGGTHHVFDCPKCGGGPQKRVLETAKAKAWNYLFGEFGNERLRRHSGFSSELIPAMANEEPSTRCQLFVIDGDHGLEGVLKDIEAAHRSRLWTGDTILLFDDVDMPGVRMALRSAMARRLLVVVEEFIGDFHVDPVFSSQHAQSRNNYTFPATFSKTFVEARFLGRGRVPPPESRTGLCISTRDGRFCSSAREKPEGVRGGKNASVT